MRLGKISNFTKSDEKMLSFSGEHIIIVISIKSIVEKSTMLQRAREIIAVTFTPLMYSPECLG